MAAAKPRAGSRTAAVNRGAKGNAKNGAAKNGTAKNGTAKNGTAKNAPAPAPAKTPAKTAARAATPPRAKSGADAARPVGPPGSGAAARRAAPARTGTAGNKPVAAADPGTTGAAEAEYEFPAAWLRWSTFVLALIGLGVSIYLTYAHYTESALAGCTETTGVVNCGKVTTSPQSVVFGIPVAVLGLAFYVFAVAIMSPWAWRARRR
ncbi:MAG TPA: vitamin K epoxide reductase family protein, partial [Streptosporangiaceae bacterium]|nr:vitamin K epoxide reductase family protein [Streptosporangiaceae bacterium]